MLVASQQAVAVSITPTVDGTIRDGLYSPKDDVPDSVIEGSIVQVLDVERDRLPFEDRGIIEFNVSTLSEPVGSAELLLTVWCDGTFSFYR